MDKIWILSEDYGDGAKPLKETFMTEEQAYKRAYHLKNELSQDAKYFVSSVHLPEGSKLVPDTGSGIELNEEYSFIKSVLGDRLVEMKYEGSQGFSINFNGLNFTPGSGYAVSVTNNVVEPETVEEIMDQCIKWLLDNKPPDKIVGGWYCRGAIYLDCSIYIESLDLARVLAKVFNQKKIWDFAAQREI